MATTKEQILGTKPEEQTQTATAAKPETTTTQQGGTTPPAQPTQSSTTKVTPRSAVMPETPADGKAAATTASTPPTEGQKRMTYAEMWQKLYDHTPQTEEQKEAERKRQRRKAIFAAIGDGVSALANLYYTNKGALNAYDGNNTLSGKLKEQWEKDKKEREAKDKEYLTGYMQSKKWDADEAKDERYFNFRKAQADVANGREETEHGWKREKHNWEEALQPYLVSKAEHDANTAANKATTSKAEADNAPDYYRGRVMKLTAQTNAANRSNTSGGGSSGGAKWAVYGADGKVIKYVRTRDEAISETARHGGTYPSTGTQTERTTDEGYGQKKTVTTRTSRTPTVSKGKYSGFSIHKK